MIEIIKAMMERRSISKFKPEMPHKEQIEQIIEAGLYAANGRGKQATITVAVTNKALRDRLAKANCKIGGWDDGFDPFYSAPVILIVLADKSWPIRVYDGSLVMGNMLLAAHSLGLGSIWIHRAKSARMERGLSRLVASDQCQSTGRADTLSGQCGYVASAGGCETTYQGVTQ